MGASGRTTVNFGAFPGSFEASVAVTGQAGIIAGSDVEAWIEPDTTADHSADEHMVEAVAAKADRTSIIAGTGFTIRAFCTSDKPEVPLGWLSSGQSNAGMAGKMQRLWGVWTVGWAWN